MEKNNCTLTGHKYGLWQLKNETTASRICESCGHNQEYPLTSDILKQIKKQQEATPLLTSFLTISTNDNNLIGYLNVILEDVLDYLSTEKKNILVNKLKEIVLTSPLSEENKILLEKLITSITSNNQDLLFDTIEYFKIQNIDILSNQPIPTQINLSK